LLVSYWFVEYDLYHSRINTKEGSRLLCKRKKTSGVSRLCILRAVSIYIIIIEKGRRRVFIFLNDFSLLQLKQSGISSRAWFIISSSEAEAPSTWRGKRLSVVVIYSDHYSDMVKFINSNFWSYVINRGNKVLIIWLSLIIFLVSS